MLALLAYLLALLQSCLVFHCFLEVERTLFLVSRHLGLVISTDTLVDDVTRQLEIGSWIAGEPFVPKVDF